MNRVIVVTHDESGQLLKVCESWESYEQWIESSEWEKYQTDTWDTMVREEA